MIPSRTNIDASRRSVEFRLIVCLTIPRFFFIKVLYCPPTKVEGDYSFGFVRPSSVDTISSPQLLQQFSRILVKLSIYCSHDLKIIFYRGHARLIFTRVMALKQFFKSKSCLCKSSCSVQWTLMKPSSYCSDALKRIILYRGQA